MTEIYTDEVDMRVLEETLTKVDGLTDNIAKSLHKLAKSSYRAERNIKPISGKTKELQIYGTNLSSSLNVIAEIREYAKMSADREETIAGGPERCGVDRYTATVREINDALQRVKNTNLQSFHKVVSRMEQSVRQGNNALKEFYSGILDRAYQPFDVTSYVKRGDPMPTIPPEHVEELRKISLYFEGAKQRVDSVYAEKVSNYILSTVGPLASSTRPKTGKSPYTKGSNTIHVYTAALKGLLEAEYQNLAALYGESQTKSLMFEQVCASSVSEYCSINGSIDTHVNNNMNSDSMLIFELIECDGLLINFIQEVCKSVPTKLKECMDKNCATAQKALVDFIRYIDSRIQNLQQLPSDNGVCEASVDIMSRMGRLAEFKQSELVAISPMKPGSWIPSPKPTWAQALPENTSLLMADPYEKLSTFFSDAIDAIILGLEFKSKTSGRKNSQTGFFMLTNYTVIEQYVMRKDIFQILGANGADRLDKLKKRGLNLFLESWKNCAAYLMDVTVTNKPGDKLSSKDREAIKEKFKLFNTEFEQLVQRHKSYNLKDQNMRQLLAKEIQFISPLYHRFYDKHCGGDFSKNVDKYIKYSKEEFDQILRSLA